MAVKPASKSATAEDDMLPGYSFKATYIGGGWEGREGG